MAQKLVCSDLENWNRIALKSLGKMSSLDAATLFNVRGLVVVITGGGTGMELIQQPRERFLNSEQGLVS